MKYILSTIFILLIQLTYAQQPFQGTIVYSLKASTEKKEAELTAMFGINKIKIKMKEKDEYDKKYIIIDLDSGKVFNLDAEARDYKITKLTSDPIEPASPKVIAGYNTIPVQSNSSGGPFGLIRQMMGGSITLYTSNELIFPIDPKYSVNTDLIIVHNNKIVLGATIQVKPPFSMADEEADTTTKMVITAEAIKIDKTPLPKEEFLIPQDYVKRKKFDFNFSDSLSMGVDTTAMLDTTVSVYSDEMDSVAAPTEKPTTKPKTKPTPSKKPVTKKGEATQRKKS